MTPPPAFESILFPVDFSPASEITAKYVRSLAENTGAELALLHVVPWLSPWYGASEPRPPITGDEGLQDLHQHLRRTLEQFRRAYFTGLHCLPRVVDGAVAETITDVAQDSKADLIMMPTRGCGPNRRFLIGSTTAKVLHDASCAVWTTPHQQKLPTFNDFRHLLCAVDSNEVPAGFLKEVVRLATCFGSRLSFITVASSTVGGYGTKRRIESLAEEFPQTDLDPAVGRGLDCMAYLETGSVSEVVSKIAAAEQVDLVVLHRGHMQHVFGKLRTHTYEIVLLSPCPVLSLSMVPHRSLKKSNGVAVQTGAGTR